MIVAATRDHDSDDDVVEEDRVQLRGSMRDQREDGEFLRSVARQRKTSISTAKADGDLNEFVVEA